MNAPLAKTALGGGLSSPASRLHGQRRAADPSREPAVPGTRPMAIRVSQDLSGGRS